MRQVTLRLDDDLAHGMKREADAGGESVNAFASRVLRAAVDPEFGGSGLERMRARFAAAGILAPSASRPTQRPDPAELEDARRAAARGSLLSDLIVQERNAERDG